MDSPSLSDLILHVRRLADIETDGHHITDEEITEYLNNSLKALWSIVVNASNGSLISKIAHQLPQLGTNSYLLPSDFLRLISVDVIHSGRTCIHSVEADPQDYIRLVLLNANSNIMMSEHYLQFNKDYGLYNLFVFPDVDPANLGVRYIPDAPQLDLLNSELRMPADWQRWAIYDAAVRCNIKDETDPAPVMIEREKIEARVIEDVLAQSPAQVETIRDVWTQEAQHRFRLPNINFPNV